MPEIRTKVLEALDLESVKGDLPLLTPGEPLISTLSDPFQMGSE